MTPFSLVARNVGRNGFRSAATALGVALAVLAFVALRTVIDAWHAGAAHANKDRLTTRHKVSYGLPLPAALHRRHPRARARDRRA